MYVVLPAIESERLLLRRFRTADLVAFTRLMTNPEVARYLSFPDEIKTKDGARVLGAVVGEAGTF